MIWTLVQGLMECTLSSCPYHSHLGLPLKRTPQLLPTKKACGFMCNLVWSQILTVLDVTTAEEYIERSRFHGLASLTHQGNKMQASLLLCESAGGCSFLLEKLP